MKRILTALILTIIVISTIPVYASAAYENTYSNTGNQRADIVEVAKTQIGNTNGLKYRSDGASWCAAFVVWCARQAGIDSSIIKDTGWATADNLGVTYKGRSADRSVGINYTPQSGDLIIFDWSSNGYCYKSPASSYGDHVGIVEYVSGGYVHTIEGNSGSSPRSVKRQTYSLNSSEIKGYGVPNYKSNHTHSYISNYEAAHPHRVYAKCSCGDWYYTGETRFVEGCSSCLQCTGYNIAYNITGSNREVFDSDIVTFTITPHINDRDAYNNEIVSIKLFVKFPDGTVRNSNLGTSKEKTFYFGSGAPMGKYDFYAFVETKYGSYQGTVGDGSLSLTLKSTGLTVCTYKTNDVIYRRIKFSDLNTYLTANSDNIITSCVRKNGDSESAQIWKLIKQSDNTYIIESLDNGKVIDVSNGRMAQGNDVSTYSANGQSNQKWELCQLGEKKYYIKAANSDSAVLDVTKGSKAEGTRVILWTYHGGSSQKVDFEYPYKISYSANNGSEAPPEQFKDYGKNTTLSTIIPKREGYTFVGWNTNSNGTGKSYSSGETYSANADITLYAVWKKEPTSYTLSYNANGGSGAPSSQTNPSAVSSTVPTRFGYTFLGWSTNYNASSASYAPGSSASFSSNVTLYAVWKAALSVSTGNNVSVNIGFANQAWYYKFTPSSSGEYVFESTGSVDSKVVIYKTDGTEIGSDDDSGDGSNFKKTLNLTSGTTYYIKAFAYSSKTGSYTFKITQKAAPVTTYTVSYNANGGSVSPSSAIVNSGSSTTLPTPTKNVTLTYNANGGSGAPAAQTVAVSCKGWSTSSSATSASYKCGASYKPTANTTLYAVWENGASTKISSTTPTRSGYKFLGWSEDSKATSASFAAGTTVTVYKNATVYAIWEKVSEPTPKPSDNVMTVRTKALRLDLEEFTGGQSTITLDTTQLGDCKLVASCSSPEALNLDFTESIYDDSVTLLIETNDVKGEFTVYVRLYNSSKTVLYKEEQIKVSVKDTSYETIYLDYKDTYTLKGDFIATGYESEDPSIASVDSNGKIRAKNTGSTFIYVLDEVDANFRKYKVEVDYNFFQWFIIIVLFGWIWY